MIRNRVAMAEEAIKYRLTCVPMFPHKDKKINAVIASRLDQKFLLDRIMGRYPYHMIHMSKLNPESLTTYRVDIITIGRRGNPLRDSLEIESSMDYRPFKQMIMDHYPNAIVSVTELY